MGVRPGYKQTEVGVIPEDWEVTYIGAEFTIQLGKMLDSEKNTGIPKPYVGNRAVQWGWVDVSNLEFMKMTPSDLQRFRLRNGDLLVCEGGEIGRCAIWNETLDECYYQKALHRLRPKSGYNVTFMLNVLRLLASNGFLLNFVTQTSIAHLPKEKLELVPIPLPPTKAEQQAIAEALSDADALIESLEQLLAKKRLLKQGAMQELLTGKRRLPGFEVKRGYRQSEVGVVPEDWEIMPFDQVVEAYIDYRGRTPRKLGLSWGGGTILALSANNVQMGRIDPEKEAYLGSEELYRKWMVQGECEVGDVLLTMEAPLGNVAQIPDSKKYILSQRVLLIKPKDWVLRDYLAHFMKGASFRSNFHSMQLAQPLRDSAKNT
ncbi:MAG: restriction endonuclease subunit S [Calditrichae bacterium]|nr:restriction endonuclease subunit S [Calditrichia bacterium]